MSMSKAEELAQKIIAGENSATTAADDSNRGRQKAAKDWVQHFMSVSKFVEESTETFSSVEQLELALVNSWTAKANDKDETLARLTGAIK